MNDTSGVSDMRELPAVADAPEALPPSVLTAVLATDGARVRGARRGEVWNGGYSIAYQILLDWGGDGAGAENRATPASVVLKVPRPDIPADVTARNARQEYRFFKELAPLTPSVPTVRCYAGAYGADRGTYCVLLEDVSATHVTPPAFNAVPSTDQALAAIEVVARLHAAWWNDPRLDSFTAHRPNSGPPPPTLAIDPQQAVEAFLAYIGDAVPEPRRRALRDIAAFIPDLVARQRAGPQTVIHGDVNWTNFFFAREFPHAGNANVLLFDWQSWDVGAPTQDLGYIFGRNWTREANVDLVEVLLRRYHQTLLANGVSADAYPWFRCWDDLRLALVRPPSAAAVSWVRWGSPSDPPERWLRYAERVFVLHDALGCPSLVPARA